MTDEEMLDSMRAIRDDLDKIGDTIDLLESLKYAKMYLRSAASRARKMNNSLAIDIEDVKGKVSAMISLTALPVDELILSQNEVASVIKSLIARLDEGGSHADGDEDQLR